MEPEPAILISEAREKALAEKQGRVWTMPESDSGLWYLAHPITGDDLFTFEDNKRHALRIQRILWRAGILVVNTWYSFSIIYGIGEGAEIEGYLNLDKAVIGALGGIILTGHLLSPGMKVEFEFAQENHLRIMNLINIPDNCIAELVKDYIT